MEPVKPAEWFGWALLIVAVLAFIHLAFWGIDISLGLPVEAVR